MSRLRQPNGDDHPDAAGKLLDDASALLTAQRNDGAAYLAGYVVECALKTLVLLERGQVAHIHSLNVLSHEALRLAAVPGARTARYARGPTPGHSMYAGNPRWTEELRYRPPGTIAGATANEWVEEARRMYLTTIAQMRLDGVI